MTVKWVSFRYRPGTADPDLEFAELISGTPPEALCQTERHMMTTYPAAYLEVFYTPEDDSLTVHRAWFACAGCHAQMEAGRDYDPV